MAFHPKYIAMAVPVVLALVLAGTIQQARHSGLRGPRLVAAWAAQFFGCVLVVTLGAHVLEVAHNWARGRSVVGDTPLAYGWRVYSLILFGAVLVAQGVACVRAARRLYAGDGAAGRDVLRTTAVVLAIVLPTVPLDAFLGLTVGGASALTAALVGWSMRSGAAAGAAAAAGAPGAAAPGSGVPWATRLDVPTSQPGGQPGHWTRAGSPARIDADQHYFATSGAKPASGATGRPPP